MQRKEFGEPRIRARAIADTAPALALSAGGSVHRKTVRIGLFRGPMGARPAAAFVKADPAEAGLQIAVGARDSGKKRAPRGMHSGEVQFTVPAEVLIDLDAPVRSAFRVAVVKEFVECSGSSLAGDAAGARGATFLVPRPKERRGRGPNQTRGGSGVP